MNKIFKGFCLLGLGILMMSCGEPKKEVSEVNMESKEKIV